MLVSLAYMTIGCETKPATLESKDISTHLRSDVIRDGNWVVEFSSNVENAKFRCRLITNSGTSNWEENCSSPKYVPTNNMEHIRELQVLAFTDTMEQKNPLVVRFQKPVEEGNYPTIQQPMFQIGSTYLFSVPEGMHITQYASSHTYQGAGSVEFLHLQYGQEDYNYLGMMPYGNVTYGNLGVNGCGVLMQDVVRINSGNKSKNYCRSNLSSQDYLSLLSGMYARNHIEVSSNERIGTQQANADGRMPKLLVQVYSPNESKLIRNRFDDLCSPSRRLGVVSEFRNAKMVEGFWLYDQIRVDKTFVCKTYLGGLNGGAYQVGGFTATTEDGEYLSVVYMERIIGSNGIDNHFAQNLQSVLLSSLKRNRP